MSTNLATRFFHACLLSPLKPMGMEGRASSKDYSYFTTKINIFSPLPITIFLFSVMAAAVDN